MLFTILLSAKGFGFGAPDLLPASERAKAFVVTTKLDKKKSFQKISVWAAKTFANSNETIKLRDSDMGVIIAKGVIDCKALKLGNGYGQNQKLSFTLEVAAANKKTDVKFNEILAIDDGSFDNGSRPSKKEELETVSKECLEPYVELIKKELI